MFCSVKNLTYLWEALCEERQFLIFECHEQVVLKLRNIISVDFFAPQGSHHYN